MSAVPAPATTSGKDVAAEPKRIIVKIGSRDVDFTEVPPITGADKKALFKEGVDMRRFSKDDGLNAEEDGKLILHLVRKVDSKVTEAEVDAIPTHIQQSLVLHFLNSTARVENPFHTPSSTSSPPSTAGDKAT